MRSLDGVNWKATYVGATNPMDAVQWTGSEFLGVGAFGAIFHSSDGAQWTVAAASTSSDLLGLATNGSVEVAVGTKGTILTSSDRVSWTARAPGSRAALSSVAWNGAAFVAVGALGTALTSPDSLAWTARVTQTAPVKRILLGVASNGKTLAAGTNGGTLLWDLSPETPRALRTIEGCLGFSMAFTRDGTWLIAADEVRGSGKPLGISCPRRKRVWRRLTGSRR